MTDQLELAGVPAAPKPLHKNQQLAHDYLRDHPGSTVEKIGAWIHAHREKRPHPADKPCEWCEKTGRQTVTSKGLAPLVTFTRAPGGSLYRLRSHIERAQAAEPTPEPTEAELALNPFAGL